MKWVANGHIAVISHESRQEPFRSHKRDEKNNLYATTHKGDGFSAREKLAAILGTVAQTNMRSMRER